MDVRHCLAANGVDPIQQWLDGLQDLKARVAILRRIDRLALDNFGDHKFCGEGVWELRVDVGPGYRVYYAQQGKLIVLLLCGGSKRTQKADIRKAIGRIFRRGRYDSQSKTGDTQPRSRDGGEFSQQS